jgi:ferredoxin
MTWLFQQLNKAIMTQGGFFCLSLVEIDNTYAFKQYINEIYKHNMAQGSKAFIRTIPIESSVESQSCVATHEDARQLLKEQELIVVTKCACRLGMSLFGLDCGKPLEVCFMFGPMGQYYIDNGLGRQIDLQEALSILDLAHEAGLIVQPTSTKRPFMLCNCCVCCCGFLRAINKMDNPAEIVFSNYHAVLERSLCVGCGVCEKRCGMKAITMSPQDELAELNPLRCIGCGLCVATCEAGAIRLEPKPGQPLLPSDDTPGMFKRLADCRGIKEIADTDLITFGFKRA